MTDRRYGQRTVFLDAIRCDVDQLCIIEWKKRRGRNCYQSLNGVERGAENGFISMQVVHRGCCSISGRCDKTDDERCTLLVLVLVQPPMLMGHSVT